MGITPYCRHYHSAVGAGCTVELLSSRFSDVVSAIGNAFGILSNPVKRKRYDEFGPEEMSRVLPRQRRRQHGSDDDDDGCYGYTYGFEGRLYDAYFY